MHYTNILNEIMVRGIDEIKMLDRNLRIGCNYELQYTGDAVNFWFNK